MEQREYGDEGLIEASANADASPEHPEGSQGAGRLDDISASLNGAQAITGKALWSSDQRMRNLNQYLLEKENEKDHDAQEEEMRELAHLAEWNAQMTTLGGVQMTNEEAQNARQHIIDHEDEYADRAVREGRISEDEKDEYKSTIKRIKYLKDLEGRGIATDEQKQECTDLQRSRVGRVAEEGAGEFHKKLKGLDASAETDNSLRRQSGPAAVDSSLFQSAPDASNHFVQAGTATEPLDTKKVPVAASSSPKAASMGVGV